MQYSGSTNGSKDSTLALAPCGGQLAARAYLDVHEACFVCIKLFQLLAQRGLAAAGPSQHKDWRERHASAENADRAHPSFVSFTPAGERE
jgi:hypothetical protein